MASRRRTLVYVAAGITLALGALAGASGVWLLGTRSGAEFVRGQAMRALAQRVQGSVTIGGISGSLLGAPVLDSVVIRDRHDSVIVSASRVSFEYDLLDIWDRRIALRNVQVLRPYVHLRRDTAGVWNYRGLFSRDSGAAPSVPRAPRIGRQFGDLILLDSVSVVGGEFHWTEPWRPAAHLRGAARDSAIAFNLARTDAEIFRDGRRFLRARHWRELRIDAPHVRIKRPDSAGVLVRFARLDVEEFDPPLSIREANGEVHVLNDTVRVRVDAFRLPGSAGSASGTLATRDGLGVRVRVIGDTVSMADIAWVYRTLPTEGGGRLTLDIRKNLTSQHIDYALSRIDVRSTDSHLTGAMTFGVSPGALEITDVNLGLAPIDFRLIEQFSGGPLPLPWAGQLDGRVAGPGGPLHRFMVSESEIAFTDANVPGVVNHFSGSGGLDIRRPAEAVFQDFALTVAHFDLRTAQALNPEFPPFTGWVNGRARLDSIYTDVRFRDGDLAYFADSSRESRFTGEGRVTFEETDVRYDMRLVVAPLDLGALALTYPDFPLRGAYSGPLTLFGTTSDMIVSGELSGEGGRVRAQGLRVDGLEPGYAMTGRLDFTNLDPARLLGDTTSWSARLNLVVDAAVSGDSAANLRGAARFTLARSQLEGVRLHHGYTAFTFGDGLARVDSAVVSSDAGALTARGALGLRADRRDSLIVLTTVDSLGGLRAFLAAARDSLVLPDSLQGSVTMTARMFGNLDSLDMAVAAQGRNVYYGGTSAGRVSLDALLADVRGARTGTVTLAAAGIGVGEVAFDSLRADAVLRTRDSAQVVARAVSATGSVIGSVARVSWDTTRVRTVLDSLRLSLRANEWRLAAPAAITFDDSGSIAIDTLTLQSTAGGTVTLAADLPNRHAIRGSLAARDVRLGDLAQLLQAQIPLSGAADFSAALSGTRDAPRLTFDLAAQNAQVGEARLKGLRVTGAYADQLLRPQIEYRRAGASVVRGEAALPLNLALRPVAERKLDRPLSGMLVADSTDLAVLEALTSTVTRARGFLDADVRLGGTWKAPDLRGHLRAGGAMSLPNLGAIRYENMRAHIRFLGDSIQIDTLSAQNADNDGRARAFGWISYREPANPAFVLRFVADRFRAIAHPDIADLTVTTDPTTALRLEGAKSGSQLVGALETNGEIRIPESYSKNIIPLDERDFLIGIDTGTLGARRLLPNTMTTLIQNLRVPEVTVRAGDNLWLRSDEARVKLGGQLRVAVSTSTRASDRGRRQLALEGELTAEQGTYRLSLGPVQRTFVVESGAVTFFGDAELNPSLSITALHTVRQYDPREARPDVRVRATIGGTLLQPTVALSSPDSLRISGADLYSYLITGAPSIEIGGRASDYARTGAGMLVSSLGSVLAGQLARGGLDYLDISTAGLEGGYDGVRRVGSGILASTRVNAGWQLQDQVFLRVDWGMCQFSRLLDKSGETSFDASEFANSLGLKLDVRFTGGLGLSAGLDPASSALTCSQAGSARGVVPTPRQLGFDIFRRWRF